MNSQETIDIINAVLHHAATIGTRVQGINQIDFSEYSNQVNDKVSVSFFDGIANRTFVLNWIVCNGHRWEVYEPQTSEFDSYAEANSYAHSMANHRGASVVIEWRINAATRVYMVRPLRSGETCEGDPDKEEVKPY